MSINIYKKELILDKNFKEYIYDYCEVFGYSKSLATRIVNSLSSYKYIDGDTRVIDFIANHDRIDINKTITFHSMGEKCYIVLLDSITALNVPLKDEPGYKKMFTDYNSFVEGKEATDKHEQYGELECEFYTLKNQLMKNQELLNELIEANKVLNDRLNKMLYEVGDLDGKKHR